LLRSLVGRWSHRVTALTGGPGLGKTTLLAQAIAENRMAPRGEDVWIGVEAHDADADRLARVVAQAVADRDAGGTDPGGPGGTGPGSNSITGPGGSFGVSRNGNGQALVDQVAPDPTTVADAVWHRAPTEACLVLDDVHLLPPGSTGAAWLSALVDALPANGHVLLASRSEPPVALTRFGTQGAVLRLAEEDLRFDEDELSGFATQRGLDLQRFQATGGWPAMAELAASVEQRFTGDYLWEEVLEPLGTVRRHVLAVLCELGGGDDDLVTAVVGTPVRLSQALDGVPLMARDAGGWYRPHGLWRTAPNLALTPSERADVRRRAADHLSRRGRFDEAFSLLQEADLWDAAPTTLRAACLASDRLVSTQLGRWLSVSSAAVRTSTAGALAEGLHTAFINPSRAVAPLEEAAARCRAEGDIDAEVVAIAQLGRLAWWRQDLEALGELIVRVMQLETTGHPTAHALAKICRAMLADLQADNEGVLGELADLDASLLDPAWEVVASWLYGAVHVELGDSTAAHEIVDRLGPTADPGLRIILYALRQLALWLDGRVDEVLAQIPPLVAAARETGMRYNLSYGLSLAAAAYGHTGDLPAARRYFAEASASAPPGPDGKPSIITVLGEGVLLLGEGEEAQARAAFEQAMVDYKIDRGMDRRLWRHLLPLSYILVPEAKAYWDGVPLKGLLAASRELSAAVLAAREGDGGARLRTIVLPELGVVRAALHFRFAAELAVGLASVGRSEGHQLLDMLGAPGRIAVRDMAANQPAQAKRARSLLAAVPAPPPQVSYLGVMGPAELRRGSPTAAPVVDADLRRKRLQALLAYLVGHRRTNRQTICAALWPDLDDRAAGNNLGVTLNHLLRVLEPWRDSGEPPYLLRLDGSSVQLVTGEHLRVDVDEFDRHLLEASRAEADGVPSLALNHDLAAVELYRGDLHADIAEADWFVLDRERCRARFVGAAVRAGQLLLGRGDAEQAETVAHRALGVDPWCEEAYAVLVGGALARRDRSAAHRMLTRCLDALSDLGVDPSLATLQLQRRLRTTDSGR
jgi:DNA-binding SARP family transcriptional activator/tetratricopeptide (TPR) repeat protein